MIIPLEFYQQLRNQLRISDIIRQYVSLTRKGSEYTGICPFHIEKTPSFTVNDYKKFYHCFGCSAHGDIIRFIAETKGVRYKDAAIMLATDHGIELPKITDAEKNIYEEKEHIYEVLELTKDFFVSQITPEARNYLNNRGLDDGTIAKFAVGFATYGNKLTEFLLKNSVTKVDMVKAGLARVKDNTAKGDIATEVKAVESGAEIYEVFRNRIIFPIYNKYTKVVGFGGRNLNNDLPKYINSPDSIVFNKSETLYGEHIATSAAYKSNYSILVEGYLDVIALHKAGFNQSVASLGTAVTETHIEILWECGEEIISCLDSDAAGLKATSKLIFKILDKVTVGRKEGDRVIVAAKKFSFLRLPQGKDPDDFIKSVGATKFAEELQKKRSLSEMIWYLEYEHKKRTVNFADSYEKAALRSRLQGHCWAIKDKVLSREYWHYFNQQVFLHLKNNQYTKSSKKSGAVEEIRHNVDLVANTPEYKEMLVWETSICRFVIRFPHLFVDNIIKKLFIDIIFQTKFLYLFKDWFVDIMTNTEHITSDILQKSIKNTSFYDDFLVLSSVGRDVAIDFTLDYAAKNNVEITALEWLYAGHYAETLKKEFKKISIDEKDRYMSYQEETHKYSRQAMNLKDQLFETTN